MRKSVKRVLATAMCAVMALGAGACGSKQEETTATTGETEAVTEAEETAQVLARLAVIGSRLAISDVGVGATLCTSAAEGAAMNVYINTKLMKDTEYANDLNDKTLKAVENVKKSCSETYAAVQNGLLGR